MLIWDYESSTIDNFRCIVINGLITDFQLDVPHEDFLEKFRELENSNNLMSGYTEKLEKNIRALWTSDELEVNNFTDEEQMPKLYELHQQLLEDQFDFSNFELNQEHEFTPLIKNIEDNEDDGDQSDSDYDGYDEYDETAMIPACDIQIAPVQGISASKLQPGDMIYVEIGEIPDKWIKLKPALEDLRDDSGLIPAQLQAKKITEYGRLDLEVQFSKKVFGSVRCSKDISLMVPESTLAKYGKLGVNVLGGLFQPKFILLALSIILVLILLAIFLI